MSKATQHGRPASRPSAAGGDRKTASVEFLPPFQPHRGWFALLTVLLIVWLSFLLVLWFRTERNHDTHNPQHSSLRTIKSPAHFFRV